MFMQTYDYINDCYEFCVDFKFVDKNRSVTRNPIKKIVIADPYVVLYDEYGRERKVEALEGDKFDPKIGLLLVLCKHIYSAKQYSELLKTYTSIDDGSRYSIYRYIQDCLSGAIIPILGIDLVYDLERVSFTCSNTRKKGVIYCKWN